MPKFLFVRIDGDSVPRSSYVRSWQRSSGLNLPSYICSIKYGCTPTRPMVREKGMSTIPEKAGRGLSNWFPFGCSAAGACSFAFLLSSSISASCLSWSHFSTTTSLTALRFRTPRLSSNSSSLAWASIFWSFLLWTERSGVGVQSSGKGLRLRGRGGELSSPSASI